MEKMKKCKTCGADIAKSAKVCPNCGAKQKKHWVLGIVLVILGIILLSAAFGSTDDGPKKVEDSSGDTSQTDGQEDVSQQPQEEEPEQPAEPEKTTFGVGEKVELNDIDVTLVSVTESNGANYMTPSGGNVFLICEFEIENNSDKDIAVSSIVSFEAYVDDYSTGMSLSAIMAADKTQLDGSVAAGKKMNGVIGYEVSSDWSELEISFTPDFWSEKDITFTYSK